jgi:DNA repair protein RadC
MNDKISTIQIPGHVNILLSYIQNTEPFFQSKPEKSFFKIPEQSFFKIIDLSDIEAYVLDIPQNVTVDKQNIQSIHQIPIDSQCTTIRKQRRLRTELLCSKVISINGIAVSDEDLLSHLLYNQSPGNSKKIAMRLIMKFETIGAVIAARSGQLLQVADVEPEMIAFLKAVGATGARLAREEITHRPLLDAWDKVISYLRTRMAHETVEQFRVLFLDRRNVLISDEVQQQGTIDHTPVYPREVVRRALEVDASAIIMVHNHPSNDPTPSKPDIEMTRQVREIVEKLGIVLHDHIIVSRRGHTSFRQMGLL